MRFDVRFIGSRFAAIVLACAATLVATPASANNRHDHGDRHHDDFRIQTLSTQPHLVTGGNVLVQIGVPRDAQPNRTRVELNGRDISASFRVDARARTLTGLVTRLKPGKNRIEVSSGHKGRNVSKLTLVNHPATGPVFSGPHQKPFQCETAVFPLPVIGGTLGPSLDDDCSVATRVDYVYMSTDGTLKPLADPTTRPSDLATTTTANGRTVNFIVRIETGTINRAIYELAVLHDPVLDPQPSPWAHPAGWNKRLLYSYGGGCGTGYHQGQFQGTSLSVVNSNLTGNLAIAAGYAVAASSLNVFGVTCNDVISAETTMMVKEHFIETFGVPFSTLGIGASGGSMQVHLISHNYPGLLDGIVPARSFPDTLTFEKPYQDCDLLVNAFNTSALAWTIEQKAAVAGHRTFQYCSGNTVWGKLVDPNFPSPLPRDTFPGCPPALPESARYDATTNPNGVRCTLYDNMINVYGTDPRTGFARRPIDNVGVQYGLKALNEGAISADQFIDLNARIGGYDVDGNYAPQRTAANRTGLRIAYQTGRINSGRGLDAIPIIDSRAYREEVGDVHDAVRSHVMRARLIKANGHADNQIIVVADLSLNYMPQIYFDYVVRMDEWVTGIKRDSSRWLSAAEKVLRNKPRDLVDGCHVASGEKVNDIATCSKLYPVSLEPRLVAGEPMADDVMKCQLRPVRRADYAGALSDEQFARLRTAFPDGVCDYGRRGVEQQRQKDKWLAYPRPGESVSLDNDRDKH